MEAKMAEAIKAKNQVSKKNEFLQARYEADMSAKENLKG